MEFVFLVDFYYEIDEAQIVNPSDAGDQQHEPEN